MALSFTTLPITQHYLRFLVLLSFLWLSTCTDSLAQAQAVSNTYESLNAVSYGGGQWITVGENGTIVTSPDAVNWTTRSSGTTSKLTSLTYAASQWIVIGENGTILTSPDGVAWTTRNPGSTAYLYDISYGAGQWIIVTEAGTLTSPDGITWTTRGTPAMSITYGAGQWASVNANQFQTSTDGVSWTSTTVGFSNYFKVRYGGGRWVMLYGIRNNTFVISSADGITWQGDQLIGDRRPINSVAYGNGLWMGVGANRAVITSTDGITWSQPRPAQFSYTPFTDVSYGGGLWVITGLGGEIFYTNNPLPVSLISFQGKAVDNTAHLTWETAWEKSASHFLIERSPDAKSFEAIGRLAAQGTTQEKKQYTFQDQTLSSGIWYYRLRQVDQDETFTYSSIIAVRIGTEPLGELTLSPNPSSGPMVLEYKAGISSVSIYSLTGRLMHQQVFEQAVDRWSWEGASKPAGLYLIRVQDQTGKVSLLRWLKQ